MANTLRFKRGLVAGIPTGVAGEPLFTTDTFDLYIGNGTTNTRFQKYIASGTTSQLLRGDGSLLTMPIVLTSPSNGQVLKYNGTSWVNDSDAGITGSGTTNYLPKFTGASTLGNSVIFDNGTTVGIGTNSPSEFVHIRTAAFGTPLLLENTGATATYIGLKNSGGIAYLSSLNNGLLFHTSASATTRMTLDASGNLGLGVTPSAWNTLIPLQIARGSFTANNSELDINHNAFYDGTWKYIANGFANNHYITGGAYVWRTAASGTAGNAITFTQPMTLTANGRLLLGTTSEGTQRLQVAGDVKFDADAATNGFYWDNTNKRLGIGTNSPQTRLQVSGGRSYMFSGDNFSIALAQTVGQANYMYLGTASDGTFYISETGGTAIVTVQQGGSVGIGTTSPLEKLDVRGNIYASQNLGVGRQPDLVTNYGVLSIGGTTGTFYRAYTGSTETFRIQTTSTTSFIQSLSGTLRFDAGAATNIINLFGTGNVVVGANTDTTEKLQVNGTMKVTGASTFGGQATFNATGASVRIATTGDAGIWQQISNNGGVFYIGRDNSTGATFGAANANCLYGDGSRDMVLFTNSTERFRLSGSTGAATFSSSVTAASFNGTTNNIFSTGGSEKMRLDSTGQLGLGATPYAWGGSYKAFDFLYGSIANTNAGNVDVAITQNAYFDGTNWLSKYTGASKRYVLSDGGHIWFNGASATSGTAITMNQVMILNTSGNLGIAMTPSYKLDVTGEARVSSAIAIGTTPDTNKPFKILKNINATVGINFENTSTGSSAFSAIQMGTDVTGATAFTNLVYASSGITEAGVYKPSGTSLVNTGSGGLNFLAVSQPIRFFTSSGNGTLRASITNDGDFTQFNGTNPSASTTDAFRMYSADVVAGNAAPHFRTENGAVIKIYQETTGVGNAIFSAGGGTGVLDDSTFDGYTLRQIVKALRNQGILA